MNEAAALIHLKEMGHEIKKKGYSFERLQESALLFWNLMFREELHFTAKHLSLLDQKKLHKLVQKERYQHEEQKIIYPLLPEGFRKFHSLDDLIVRYDQSRWSYFSVAGKKVVGIYVPEQDHCYVLSTAPRQQQAITAIHELTHRQVHHRRKGIKGQKKLLVNNGKEEEFCRDVEFCYWDFAFNKESSTFPTKQKCLQQEYVDVISNKNGASYTREKIRFYQKLMWDERL